MIKKSGCDESLESLTLPQMNHDLYIVMNELNKLLKMKTKKVMKNENKNLSEYGLTEIKTMSNPKTNFLNYLKENDLKGILSIRRENKKMYFTTFSDFYSKEELKSHNERVRERLKVIDDYLMDNYSNEVNDFIEYEGKTIEKSNVLIGVWEDKWCRNEGVMVEMNGCDFQGLDYESLIDSIKEYYVSEIKSKRGCIEVEVNGKPILHISPDSKNKWEVI